ncbi:MAG: hypothetical protein IPI67_20395 [Myxococcales bacterium]|nr:hypothetical protein [Myxococcales bacterium]
MPSSPLTPIARRALPWLPWAVIALGLGVVASRAILAATGGEPGVPLDDTYIHFQYARSFAAGHPLVYTPGSSPTPGATSLLWPLVLSPFVRLGFDGVNLIWIAWLLGWVSLSLLALETFRLANGLTSRPIAAAAGAMVPAFGGLVWSAGSGMEIVPFAWLLVLAARMSAEWVEADPAHTARRPGWLILVACLALLMRPEGVLASIIAAVAFGVGNKGRARLWGLAPLLGLLLVPACNRLLTGQSTSTTALAKWLPLNPYHQDSRLGSAIFANIELLFGTLFDGRIWSALFLPTGGRWVAWLALPALLWLSLRKKRITRGSFVLLLALGMLIPASFDCMLCNRLRYLWPFAPAWFIALGALAESFGTATLRFGEGMKHAGLALAAGFVGAFAAQLSPSIDDLAASSNAIREQQTSLGRWAKDNLPADALIGVNDTGAIAYFSGRRTFDVVGLTTRSEPRYWAAGAGSRFEHYEHMPRAELPTHFIVYPEWMAVPPLMGQELTSRSVRASILGGTTMIAYVADYETLGSADAPRGEQLASARDRLDVADLESESGHGYSLFWATQPENRVHEMFDQDGHRADGGRSGRTLERFTLDVAPAGRLVARLSSDKPLALPVQIGGRQVGKLELRGDGDWEELALTLPADLAAGPSRVEVAAPSGESFTSLHYWSFVGGPPHP